MTLMTYQDWRNYETWAVNLWLTNSRRRYELCKDMARDALRVKTSVTGLEPRHRLADDLAALVGDVVPEKDAVSLVGDLLSHALEVVDWHEIAESLLKDVPTEEVAWT